MGRLTFELIFYRCSNQIPRKQEGSITHLTKAKLAPIPTIAEVVVDLAKIKISGG